MASPRTTTSTARRRRTSGPTRSTRRGSWLPGRARRRRRSGPCADVRGPATTWWSRWRTARPAAGRGRTAAAATGRGVVPGRRIRRRPAGFMVAATGPGGGPGGRGNMGSRSPIPCRSFAPTSTRERRTASRGSRCPKNETSMTRGEDGSMRITAKINPLPQGDDWALLNDGTVAVVRVLDYHVDYYTRRWQARRIGAAAVRLEAHQRRREDQDGRLAQDHGQGGAPIA